MNLAAILSRDTDPAVTTLVLGSAAGLIGDVIAGLGLAGRQLFHHNATDVAASALIGAVLLATSVVLLRTNRELLTGRGLPAARIVEMRTLAGSHGQ